MRVNIPYPESRDGTLELIGSPMRLSETPVGYRRENTEVRS
jgi:hypothetical protein